MKWTHYFEALLASDLVEPGSTVQWHPAIPVGVIKKMKTPKGVQPFAVTKQYLEQTRDELRRYYADIKRELGSDYKRPVLIEHRIQDAADELHASADDNALSGVALRVNEDGEVVLKKNGRRSGSILDLEVRKFDPKDPTNPESPNAVDWLFFKVDWKKNAYRALLESELDDISVNIQPRYTDPETGITYGPFLLEVSETVSPVIKSIDLQSTMDPQVLESIGLQLADHVDEGDEQMNEEMKEFLAQLLAQMQQMSETQKEMLELLMAMKGGGEDDGEGDPAEAGDKTETSDDDPAPAPTKVEAGDEGDDGDDGEPAPAKAPAVPNEIAAVLSDLVENQSAMKSQIDQFVKAGALFSDPGASTPTRNEPKPKITEAEAWARAEKELGENAPIGKVSARSAEILEKGA